MRKKNSRGGQSAQEHNDHQSGASNSAVEAVRADQALLRRLIAAEFHGFAIDVSGLSVHRRAAAVEDALDAWDKLHGGPCSACGTTTARRGYLWRSLPVHERAAEPLEFIERNVEGHDLTLCGWCADWLSEPMHDLASLRWSVFRASAGIALTDGRHFLQPLFFQTEGAVPGTPWSYVDTQKARRQAVQEKVPAAFLARNEYLASRCHFDTIKTEPWRTEDLPKDGVRFYADPRLPADRIAAREFAQAAAARKKVERQIRENEIARANAAVGAR